MSEITREELAAFTEASTKSAVALVQVSTALEGIATNQDKFTEKVSTIIEEKIKNSSMSRDIEHTKWLVSIVGLVIIIVTVIFKFSDVGPNGKMIKENSDMIQILLKDHAHDNHGVVTHTVIQGEPIGQ